MRVIAPQEVKKELPDETERFMDIDEATARGRGRASAWVEQNQADEIEHEYLLGGPFFFFNRWTGFEHNNVVWYFPVFPVFGDNVKKTQSSSGGGTDEPYMFHGV